jgi:alkylated DNA nucleotide flippase Atl1
MCPCHEAAGAARQLECQCLGPRSGRIGQALAAQTPRCVIMPRQTCPVCTCAAHAVKGRIVGDKEWGARASGVPKMPRVKGGGMSHVNSHSVVGWWRGGGGELRPAVTNKSQSTYFAGQ